MAAAELHHRLRALVGRRCRLFGGDEWQVIDILPEEHSLVLSRSSRSMSPIQTDAFGKALRRAPETRVVPYIDDNGEITEEAQLLLASLQPR